MRVFVNRAGLSFDAGKTEVVFAEDLNEIMQLLGIDTSAQGCIVHGVTASTVRPAIFDVVIWVGTVEPTNALDNDIWLDGS